MIAREVDFPPVWLAGFAALGFVAGRIYPLAFPYAPLVAAIVVAVALGLMVIAVFQMVFARTTVIPRRDPMRLVTSGLFRFSRNPIYLADAILLAGLYIHWQALAALPLVALFMYLITMRFILDEEARLAEHFGADFATYKNRTRRWI